MWFGLFFRLTFDSADEIVYWKRFQTLLIELNDNRDRTTIFQEEKINPRRNSQGYTSSLVRRHVARPPF